MEQSQQLIEQAAGGMMMTELDRSRSSCSGEGADACVEVATRPARSTSLRHAAV
ncbi:hypothetical protein ACIQM0_23140 [Streptomyces sp. NPDC091387]|uniref:hypothetical protein n=1 Tax=Streptomyces sp. NPDC091387 TaxID=3365998 RepID=UPI003822A00B